MARTKQGQRVAVAHLSCVRACANENFQLLEIELKERLHPLCEPDHAQNTLLGLAGALASREEILSRLHVARTPR